MVSRFSLRLGCGFALLLLSALPVCAQTQPPNVQEIIRKAKAGENESGFCATTGWWAIPVGEGERNRFFNQYYNRADVDSLLTSRKLYSPPPSCHVAIVTRIMTIQGRRCVREALYICGEGGRCVADHAWVCWSPRAGKYQPPSYDGIKVPD